MGAVLRTTRPNMVVSNIMVANSITADTSSTESPTVGNNMATNNKRRTQISSASFSKSWRRPVVLSCDPVACRAGAGALFWMLHHAW